MFLFIRSINEDRLHKQESLSLLYSISFQTWCSITDGEEDEEHGILALKKINSKKGVKDQIPRSCLVGLVLSPRCISQVFLHPFARNEVVEVEPAYFSIPTKTRFKHVP